MDRHRRGFVTKSVAVGLGAFVFSSSKTGVAEEVKSGIPGDSVLIAMPEDKYYAVPSSVMSAHSVSRDDFLAEEKRRQEGDEIKYRGNPPKKRKRRRRSHTGVALGVRG